MAKTSKLDVLTRLGLAARASRTVLSARLSHHGLYSGQDAVLLALAETGGLSLRELAARLQVKPPTITKTIARLSAHALVEKRLSPSDARQSFAHLTERGSELVDEIRRSQREVAAQALAGVSAKDRKRMNKILRRMERNLALAEDLAADIALPDPTDDAVVEPTVTMLRSAGSSA